MTLMLSTQGYKTSDACSYEYKIQSSKVYIKNYEFLTRKGQDFYNHCENSKLKLSNHFIDQIQAKFFVLESSALRIGPIDKIMGKILYPKKKVLN